MPVVACPVCAIRYNVGAPRPGMGLRCKCGRVFDPEPQLPSHTAKWTTFNPAAIDEPPPEAIYVPYVPEPRPRSAPPPMYIPEPPPRQSAILWFVCSTMVGLTLFCLILFIGLRKPIGEVIAKTPDKPKPLAKWKPAPPKEDPTFIPEPPKAVFPRPPAPSQPLDPYDQLANEINAITPGLTWARRVDGVPGRTVHNAKNQAAIVVMTDDVDATVKSGRTGLHKGDDTWVRGKFVFIGDKALIDSIRNLPKSIQPSS